MGVRSAGLQATGQQIVNLSSQIDHAAQPVTRALLQSASRLQAQAIAGAHAIAQSLRSHRLTERQAIGELRVLQTSAARGLAGLQSGLTRKLKSLQQSTGADWRRCRVSSPLTDGVAPELLGPPANALRVTLHPDGMAPRIVNLDEWSAHLLHRLRRQASITGDPELGQLHDELSSYPGVSREALPDEITGAEIMLPLRIRDGDKELAFFSTVSTFGTAIEITLAELVIEAFYPANAHTAGRLMQDIGASPGSAQSSK